jgi:Nucleotidyl transferase AbiEii toxin, Type IV TA system
MTRLVRPRMDVLPEVQRQLWPALRPAEDLGFVLYGGTAIALQLGHRTSVDFDFFTERPLDVAAIRSDFPFMARGRVLQEQPDTFSVQVPAESIPDEVVNVSFFGSIGIGRVGVPHLTDDGVLSIASLDDLMATKVKVILQRVEAKDYQDIAAMIGAGVSLAKGLASARQMYGPAFQPSESLKAMVYFEGGDLHTLSKEVKDTLIYATRAVHDLPDIEIASRSLSRPRSEPPFA